MTIIALNWPPNEEVIVYISSTNIVASNGDPLSIYEHVLYDPSTDEVIKICRGKNLYFKHVWSNQSKHYRSFLFCRSDQKVNSSFMACQDGYYPLVVADYVEFLSKYRWHDRPQ